MRPAARLARPALKRLAATGAAGLFCALAATGAGATEVTGHGGFEAQVPFAQDETHSLRVAFEISWKIWTLMGEPVQVLKVRWHPKSGNIPVPAPGVRSIGLSPVPETIRLKDVPQAVRDKIHLYDVKIGVSGVDGANRPASVIFDAGIPDKAGKKWSFNVPGSPNWRELFLSNRIVQGIGRCRQPQGYLSADAAKDIMRKPDFRVDENVLAGGCLVSGMLDISAVWDWWREKTWPKLRYEANYKAARAAADKMYRLLGRIPRSVKDNMHDAAIASLGGDNEKAERLAERAARILEIDLPSSLADMVSFKTKDGRTLSGKAVMDEYNSLRIELKNDLGKRLEDLADPGTESNRADAWMERVAHELDGRQALLDRRRDVELSLIDGWVMADGEKISGPYEDAMLVLEDKIIVPARGGVRLLDAFTGELVRDHPGFFRGWGNAEEYSVSKKVGEWFRACSRGLNLCHVVGVIPTQNVEPTLTTRP